MLAIPIDPDDGTLAIAPDVGWLDTEGSERSQSLTDEEARRLVAEHLELLEVRDVASACQRILDDGSRHDDNGGGRQVSACLRERLLGCGHGTSKLHFTDSFTWLIPA